MASDDRPPALPPIDPGTALPFPTETLTPELLAGLLADGDDELAAWALTHALTSTSRVEVYDGLLTDAMRLVGERWASGRWSVAEEHLASQTLLRALERVRPELGPGGRVGPLAVLAGVAGEHHMIGLVCLDHLLREAGWTVANLGADVPSADLGRFVERNEARLVALTASDPSRLPAVADAVAAVHAGGGTRGAAAIPVLLGGRLAQRADVGLPGGVDGVGATFADAMRFAATVAGRLA